MIIIFFIVIVSIIVFIIVFITSVQIQAHERFISFLY